MSSPYLTFPAAALLLTAWTASATAQVSQFPYAAVVENDIVLVRSGPGRLYYPTGRLAVGDRVTVHRHDPGGWYMIAPPVGSFSWVPAKVVARAGNVGTITAISVPIQVGSRFDDEDRGVEARVLSKGERVEILEEKMLGNEAMLKIVPPRLEYRWVAGGALSPINAAIRQARNRDPYAEPPGAIFPDPSSDKKTAQKTNRKNGHKKSLKTGSTTAASNSPINLKPYQTLEAFDQAFAATIAQPPAEWSFARLESGYRTLLAETDIPGFPSLVQRRLAAIRRYRVRRSQLTGPTRPGNPILQAGYQALKPTTQPTPQPQPQPQPTPQPTHPTPPAKQIPQPIRTRPSVVPQFSGAGIVRPLTTADPRLPRWVLVAPDGRLLAFLHPARGVELSGWVNQPVGLMGPRTFRKDLQADLIVVRSVSKVRLKR